MQSPRLLPIQQAQRALKWPLLLGALLLPYLFYDVFPNMGVTQFSNLFELERSFTFLAMLIVGIFYIKYLSFIRERPLVIVLFITSFAVIGEALNQTLMDNTPINIKYRVMLFLTIVVPSFYFLFQYFPAFNRTIAYLKYYFAFVVMLIIYFFFYNIGMTDPKRSVDSIIGDGSYSWGQINSYLMIFSGIVVSAFALIKSNKVVETFDKINVFFLSSTALASLYTIIGYPLQLTSHTVDGFLRARGLLAHANPFAHHMAVILVYQLGIYFYYQFAKEKRVPSWLLMTSFLLNLMAFLLALSKTAIATTVICAIIFFVLNVGTARFRLPLLRTLMVLLLLLPVGVFGYELATGKSLSSVIEARMEETTSLTWRNEVWDALKADLMETPVFGHGFTASNQRIFQLYYNTTKNKDPLIMVHNGYIGLFYDFGLLGYLLFAAAASLIWTGAVLWYKYENFRPLSSTVISLGVYFLVVCNFDEMVYMFDSPHLIWALSTLMVTLILYLTRQASLKPMTPVMIGKGIISNVPGQGAP
jgi:O-antigen ligase